MRKRLLHLSSSLALMFGLALSVPPRIALAAGNTYVVTGTADTSPIPACTGGPTTFSCPTLRAAVIAANAAAGADTIQLNHGATYTLAIGPTGGNDATSGDLNITSDVMFSLPLVICFPVCGAIIQGAATPSIAFDRVVHIANNVSVTMNQLTIRHGNTTSVGGGILNAGFLTMANSTVALNVAGAGGGIYSNGGSTALDNVRVLSNVVPANGDGGGLYNYVGQVTLNNSLVQGNQAESAGGIFNRDQMTLTGSTVMSNTANGAGAIYGGGGIWNNTGQLTLNTSTIQGNVADNGGVGGAIYSTGIVTVTFSTIQNNAVYGAGFGGGVANINGTFNLLASTLVSNTVSAGYGGGLYNNYASTVIVDLSTVAGNVAGTNGGGGLYNNGIITLTNSTLANNSGSGGGGAFNNGSFTGFNTIIVSNTSSTNGGGIKNVQTLTMRQSTFSGNSAASDGGALTSNNAAANPAATLDYVTITNNIADSDQNGSGDGGGIKAYTSITLTNSIIAENVDGGGQAPECSGTLTSLGYNLIQNTAGCTLTGLTTGNLLSITPMLRLLQDNGGATLTHALLPVSPAVDAADPNNCPSKDQRNFARPVGPRCDIGAYEYGGPPALKVFLPLIQK